MRWTASDEPGWIADLREAATAVRNHRDPQTGQTRALAWLMADLYELLHVTTSRLEVIFEERQRLRRQDHNDEAGQ